MSYTPGGSSSGSSVGTSSDVALNNPVTSDLLTYDKSIGKWKNAPSSSYTKAEVSYALNLKLAVIFFDTVDGVWPVRSSVGNPVSVEWRGPGNNLPPIDSVYARDGYDTFYAIS